MNKFMKRFISGALAAGIALSGFSVYAEETGSQETAGDTNTTADDDSSETGTGSSSAAGEYSVGTFTNIYTADPVTVTGDKVQFSKSLINASNNNAEMEMTDKEFQFKVEWIGSDFYKGGDPSSVKESGEKTKAYTDAGTEAAIKGTFPAAVFNDAEGKIKVGFTFEDPGEVLGYGEGDHAVYHFTVKENTGSNSHMKYSDGIGKVDITVKRSGTKNEANGNYDLDGKLALGNISVTAPDGGKFTNIYTADPVSVKFTASKTLVGKALKAGDYEFQLSGDSIETQDKKNDANGKITFDSVEYKNVGDYSISVREIVPDKKDSHVKYDSAEKKYTVHVTDDNGTLKTEIKAR